MIETHIIIKLFGALALWFNVNPGYDEEIDGQPAHFYSADKDGRAEQFIEYKR